MESVLSRLSHLAVLSATRGSVTDPPFRCATSARRAFYVQVAVPMGCRMLADFPGVISHMQVYRNHSGGIAAGLPAIGTNQHFPSQSTLFMIHAWLAHRKIGHGCEITHPAGLLASY